MRILITALLLLGGNAFLFAEDYYATVGDCGSLPTIGQKEEARTNPFPVAPGRTIVGIVTLVRGQDERGERQCSVTYKLVESQGATTRTVFSHTERVHWYLEVGITLIATSPNGRKFIGNLWNAAGDYEAVRPFVYDLKTASVLYSDLGELILKTLPKCGYDQELIGVDNAGRALIHIPQSSYIEEGCPDQGDWLFNPKTNTVRRVKQ